MKRILVSIFLGFIAIAVSAKTYDSDILPSDRNHWTITASYDLSIPGKWKLPSGSVKMFKPGSGVSVGADYMLLFGNNFFFEPGARLYFDSYKYDDIVLGADDPKSYNPSVWKTGLHIPLTVGYKFDIFKNGSLFLSTGPEAEFGFSARTKIDEVPDDIFEENLYKSQMRRYDIAWDIRAAVIINHFRVDLTGALGMLDVMKTDPKMHEYRISVGLGYVF